MGEGRWGEEDRRRRLYMGRGVKSGRGNIRLEFGGDEDVQGKRSE